MRYPTVATPTVCAESRFRPQRTLARSCAVSGFGLWSGRDVRVEFRPAPADSGIVFVREDLPRRPRIPAGVDYRTTTPLRTTLQNGDAGVDMVEHILAVLFGMGVDDCEIGVDSQEMPGCDGSAAPFADAIADAGLVELDRIVIPRAVTRHLRVESGNAWIEATPSPEGRLELHYTLDYGRNTVIGRQELGVTLSPGSFRAELAAARTFTLKAEAEALRSQGLGLRATYRDLLVFDESGPLENRLRFSDECVRHKLLDLVGDLALVGRPLVGRIRACRSGHRLNAELVRAVLAGNSNDALRCA